jgi:hypothetical protein
VLEIFNELGGQGWRMVDRTVTHTTVYDYTYAAEFYGHKQEIGAPVVAEAEAAAQAQPQVMEQARRKRRNHLLLLRR